MISGTLTKAGVKGLQGDLPGQVFYGIAGKNGEDGGYYTPAVTQPEQNKIQFDFTPSKADMPAVKPVQVELPAGQGSGGNVDKSKVKEIVEEYLNENPPSAGKDGVGITNITIEEVN